MLKKIFLSMSIFAIFFFVSSPAKAEGIDTSDDYGATCTLRKCEVPIPTLIAPDKVSFSGKNDIYLVGLTWNNTKIRIYLDEKYQGEAVVQKDDSGIANFYYKLASNTVDKGNHKWAVIATGGFSRSFVSKENTFYVSRDILRPVLPKIQESIEESKKEVVDILENTSSTTSSVDMIIEPVSTSTESGEIGKVATSSDSISTSTEVIILPENTTSTPEVLIKEPVVEPVKEKVENVVNTDVIKEIKETPINIDNTEKTSSIKENEDGVVISSVKLPREVNVYEKSESDVNVNVAEGVERKSLVVDDNNYKPSENQPSVESGSKENGIAEKLQNAKPEDVLLEKVKQELGLSSDIDKQKKNRIIGIAILSIIIVLYVIVVIVRRKSKE